MRLEIQISAQLGKIIASLREFAHAQKRGRARKGQGQGLD